MDENFNRKVLHGQVTLDVFEMDMCKEWYSPEYNSYKIKKGILKKLKTKKLDNISISLILGSWCHDTHREVPRFIKILDAIDFPFENLHMNALDTRKSSPDYDTKSNSISKVPTAIIYKGGIELGRIIESPKKTLEKDLLRILSKK